MTRDDVFWLMQEAGAAGWNQIPQNYEGFVDVFERFANLVEAKEREECAKVVEAAKKRTYSDCCDSLDMAASLIRKRSNKDVKNVL